jgi:hypothetical protein
MVMGLDFGVVKKIWRAYLDEGFDHHLCLNENDPLVLTLQNAQILDWGIVTIGMDPTVENMARLWGMWAARQFHCTTAIKVHEAATNAATWRSHG